MELLSGACRSLFRRNFRIQDPRFLFAYPAPFDCLRTKTSRVRDFNSNHVFLHFPPYLTCPLFLTNYASWRSKPNGAYSSMKTRLLVILAVLVLATSTGFSGGWHGGGWHGGYYGGRRYWHPGYYRWNGGWRWFAGGYNPWWVFLPPIVPVPFPYPYYGGYGYGPGYGYGGGY
jgi:hypothetical protein